MLVIRDDNACWIAFFVVKNTIDVNVGSNHMANSVTISFLSSVGVCVDGNHFGYPLLAYLVSAILIMYSIKNHVRMHHLEPS